MAESVAALSKQMFDAIAGVRSVGAVRNPARSSLGRVTRPLDDATDRLIASALIADGRSTLKTLAEATGLSVSAVQARVRRLEGDGVIRGYTALIDPEAIGLPLAAIIAMTPLDPEHEYDIPELIAGLPEVESCHSVAGEDSFVVFVRVAVTDRARGADPRDPPARECLDAGLPSCCRRSSSGVPTPSPTDETGKLSCVSG